MPETDELPPRTERAFGLPEMTAFVGTSLIVIGIGLMHVPSALIAAGTALIVAAVLAARL